jgi:hypothetical protein
VPASIHGNTCSFDEVVGQFAHGGILPLLYDKASGC